MPAKRRCEGGELRVEPVSGELDEVRIEGRKWNDEVQGGCILNEVD